MGIYLPALETPPLTSDVWEVIERKRRGLPMTLAEYLRIAEALAFPTVPHVLQTVAEALAEAKTEHLLVGGFAIGALSAHPRATEDIDLFVWAKGLDPLCAALTSRFGELQVQRFPSLTRVASPAIDIVVADAVPLRAQAMAPELTQTIEFGGATLRLPIPESEVVLKLAAALSPARSGDDTRQDITDLGRLIAHSPNLDVDLIVRLARPLRTRSPKETAKIVRTFQAGGGIAVSKQGSKPTVIYIPP